MGTITDKNGVRREMTPEEQAEYDTHAEKVRVELQAEEQAKAQKKADALAGNNKLLELGLTQAQVTAMTGYTPPAN